MTKSARWHTSVPLSYKLSLCLTVHSQLNWLAWKQIDTNGSSHPPSSWPVQRQQALTKPLPPRNCYIKVVKQKDWWRGKRNLFRSLNAPSIISVHSNSLLFTGLVAWSTGDASGKPWLTNDSNNQKTEKFSSLLQYLAKGSLRTLESLNHGHSLGD